MKKWKCLSRLFGRVSRPDPSIAKFYAAAKDLKIAVKDSKRAAFDDIGVSFGVDKAYSEDKIADAISDVIDRYRKGCSRVR